MDDDLPLPRVREARQSDVPQLVELMAEFYAEAGYSLQPEPASRSFTRLVSDRALGRVWLLEWDGEPVGYAVLTFCFSMEYGGLRGFVDDLFVLAPFRGRGLGSGALDAMRDAAPDLGLRALLVEVGPENDAARRVYDSRGLEDNGRLLLTLPLEAPVHLV
jgi:GNAT superfamily N-acetyltransferase